VKSLINDLSFSLEKDIWFGSDKRDLLKVKSSGNFC
jgi:hypothetical protein